MPGQGETALSPRLTLVPRFRHRQKWHGSSILLQCLSGGSAQLVPNPYAKFLPDHSSCLREALLFRFIQAHLQVFCLGLCQGKFWPSRFSLHATNVMTETIEIEYIY